TDPSGWRTANCPGYSRRAARRNWPRKPARRRRNSARQEFSGWWKRATFDRDGRGGTHMAITPLGDRRPIWIAILGLLALPTTGRANVGPPYRGGQLTADPVGIKDVAIEREELTINLRPLAEVGRARVEAVYHLNNAGAERKLDLLFASGSA